MKYPTSSGPKIDPESQSNLPETVNLHPQKDRQMHHGKDDVSRSFAFLASTQRTNLE